MQQLARAKPTFPMNYSFRGRFVRHAIVKTLLLVAVSLVATGCRPDTEGPQPATTGQPETSLVVSCPDERLGTLLAPMARVWAARTGAKLDFHTKPMAPGDAADVGIVPFAELGTWADRGELVPVPTGLREPGHPYQWSAVLASYRGEPYAGWGDQVLGLPIAGPGHVIVYRADRLSDQNVGEAFRARFNRALAVPSTWEEFTDVAQFFADKDQRPSLPPLPGDPGAVVDLFSRVAACHDQPALSDADPGQAATGPTRGDALTFYFRPDNGLPRLDTPAFTAAAGWLSSWGKRAGQAGGSPDPVAALLEDRAVLAVLSLSDLSRLRVGGRVADRFGVAPLPGSKQVVNPATGVLMTTRTNYIPFFNGGWVGVVRKGCKKPEAAFDLLAELGGPTRSTELVAAGGFGPLRDSHLEPAQLVAWLGYGFNAERTKALQDALRQYVVKAVRNPTFGLRGPDHAALTAALAAELKQVVGGTVDPKEGMKRVVLAWDAATPGVSAEKRKEWRRRAVGLN